MSVKNKIEDLNDYFKLPIYYNKNKTSIKKNIITDLELTKTVETIDTVDTVDTSNKSIYSYYFNITNKSIENPLSEKIIHQVSEYYTTDVDFIKDNQNLLKTFTHMESQYHGQYINNKHNKYNKIIQTWNEIKGDTGFKERYYYIDWPMWEFLNNSQPFLQFMSIYNMTSPVISLFVPIIILIIPFFIIRLKGLKLTMQEYIDILKIVISQHAIGKLFTHFNSVSFQEKIYLVASAGFYVFSIYQNILVCYRFHDNMKKIHKYFEDFKEYLHYTIESMKNYSKYSEKLITHNEFNKIVNDKILILNEIKCKLDMVSEFKYDIKKITEIGHILKTFYEIYNNKIYEEAIMYSFGFNGYVDCIIGLQENIKEGKINFAQFTNERNKTKNNSKIKIKNKNIFKNSYYACLKDKKHVKNTIKLNKNIIISGPNASGKTTIIKSTLINIIVSQQFGCGFYGSALLKPYEHIHCYLNIPDTSGRDSLFQAEARRCKEIIDIIDEDLNCKDSHFCAFDELYSGTNPDEATISAIAFMKYIIKNKNVNSILTTHFIDVCKNLDKHKMIENHYMETNKKENKLEYLYELKKGISKVKGGINVLYEMNYPSEIIENTIIKE
jgi:ABC-type multidrug transport system fused ATPase/permease subunit